MEKSGEEFSVVLSRGGGHFFIKMTGGLTLRLLPRTVQQLKSLPKVDINSYF